LLNKFTVDKPVFYTSVILIACLVAFAGFYPTQSGAFFSALQKVIILGFSRIGDIKLGLDHSEPEYSNLSWFAMLFSAGMGIGLMFFGVAEPVMHYMAPPQSAGGTVEAAREAMQLTFFHWGLHAWSIYAIVALILGYFAHRHGLPLTLRSALYPLIGERIYGKIGASVDIFAIIGTTCGIATSLGLGVIQINAGLEHLFGIPVNSTIQVILIVVTMGLATASVILGLDAGIKRLSQLNMLLAAILIFCIVAVGPTIFIFQAFMQNVGAYLSEIVSKTFNLYAYSPTDWLGGWTILYWGWWLSWAPFVGIFIARISKGRTIREFVLGAMLVPCAFTLFWMSIFGNSAIDLISSGVMSNLGELVQQNQSVALFKFLEAFPIGQILGMMSLLMVMIFFITSADSGAMVLNMLSANGQDDTSVLQRVMWTVLIGFMTIVLLYAGGLSALQTASIAGALPFSIALLFAIYGLFKALKADFVKRNIENFAQLSPETEGVLDWRKRLNRLMHYPESEQVNSFLSDVVMPAMQEFSKELESHGISSRTIDNIAEAGRVALKTDHNDELDFFYQVQCSDTFIPQTSPENDVPDKQYFRAEVHLSEGGQSYDVMGWSQQQMLIDMVSRYENHMHFIHTHS